MLAEQIEESIIDIERQIRASHPEVMTLFIKPQTDDTWQRALRLRFGEPATDAGAQIVGAAPHRHQPPDRAP